MARSDLVEVDGVVLKMIKGGKYDVGIIKDQNSLTDEKRKEISKCEDPSEYVASVVNCHLGGKLRMNKISVVPGDIVTISLSPYDLTKGSITWRYRV